MPYVLPVIPADSVYPARPGSIETPQTIRQYLDVASPQGLADVLRLILFGRFMRSQDVVLQTAAPAADLSQLSTLSSFNLDVQAPAASVQRAYSRVGTTGELANQAVNTTPSTGQIAVAPNGGIVVLTSDAQTTGTWSTGPRSATASSIRPPPSCPTSGPLRPPSSRRASSTSRPPSPTPGPPRARTSSSPRARPLAPRSRPTSTPRRPWSSSTRPTPCSARTSRSSFAPAPTSTASATRRARTSTPSSSSSTRPTSDGAITRGAANRFAAQEGTR